MSRVSEQHIIKDKQKFDEIFPQYIQILDYLKKKYPVLNCPEYENLVNFKNNTNIPKHNWLIYKQGYAEELVSKIIKEVSPSKEQYILDPFCGVGTTNLVSQSLGYKSIGFDINPVATFAAQVKTTYYSERDKSDISNLIKTFTPSGISELATLPKVINTSFEPEKLNDLLRIKYFFENLEYEKKISNFFKLAFLSIIEDCSIKTKDGNGIKLNLNKKRVENVYSHFLKKCDLMLNDLETANYQVECNIVNSSIYKENPYKDIISSNISLSIFSPPYANCFDYCEVYKLELWLGEFVKDYAHFSLYRENAMRSHVNSRFDHNFDYLNTKVDLTANLISTFNIWNRNIPDMIRGYFDDVYKLLKTLHPLFSNKGKCFIVVANSGYRGILVPTDLFIAEIAEYLGYSVKRILNARKIRASSQQMSILHNEYQDMMRETIIEIEKG